jgi:hypothetical protein
MANTARNRQKDETQMGSGAFAPKATDGRVPSHEEIAQLAYDRWQQQGCPPRNWTGKGRNESSPEQVCKAGSATRGKRI